MDEAEEKEQKKISAIVDELQSRPFQKYDVQLKIKKGE